MARNDQPQATPQQAQHFWEAAADQLASVVAAIEQIDGYLPDETTSVMDARTAQDILEALQSARASADTAAGAYAREVRGMQYRQPDQQAAPAPQQQVPAGGLGGRSYRGA